jgi:hypothetical protein
MKRRRRTPRLTPRKKRKKATPPPLPPELGLPVELWAAEVMPHVGHRTLARLAQTCRALYHSAWHRHVTTLDGACTKHLTGEHLTPYAPTLRTLVLHLPCHHDSGRLVTMGLERCVALQTLHLIGNGCGTAFWSRGVGLPPNVEVLRVGPDFRFDQWNLDVRHFVKSLPRLRVLELRDWVARLTPAQLETQRREDLDHKLPPEFLARVTITHSRTVRTQKPLVNLVPWQPSRGWDWQDLVY